MDINFKRYPQQIGDKSLPIAGTSNIRITAKNEGLNSEFGNRGGFDILEVHKPPIITWLPLLNMHIPFHLLFHAFRNLAHGGSIA